MCSFAFEAFELWLACFGSCRHVGRMRTDRGVVFGCYVVRVLRESPNLGLGLEATSSHLDWPNVQTFDVCH